MAEQSVETAQVDLRDHEPVIGMFGPFPGFVGCACMSTHQWHGYVTAHGGPGWLAYAQHITAQVTSPPGTST